MLLLCVVCIFVWTCEYAVFSNAHVWMRVCMRVRKCLSEHGGWGLPWGPAVWRCGATHSSWENTSDGTTTAVANIYRFVGFNKPYDNGRQTHTHLLRQSLLHIVICLLSFTQCRNMHPNCILPFFIHTSHYFCLPHRNLFWSITSSKRVPACTNGRTF